MIMLIGLVIIILGFIAFFSPELLPQSLVLTGLSRRVGMFLMALGIGFAISYDLTKQKKIKSDKL